MQDIQTSIELGVDLMKDIVAAGYSFLKEQERNSDSIEAATRRYVGGLIERYNNVKVLGMREPVPLKSLYVRANILEKISARTGLRPEDLETYFDRDKRTFGKITEPVDGEAIANRLQKFIVLGKPGAGKTTYLRFMTLMMLDPASDIKKKKRRLPIFVSLHDWAQKTMPLMAYLIEQFDSCGFEGAQLFLKQILEQGKCLILFDGLDEVSHEADQDGIIRQIRYFTDKYYDNQFIISCRVAAYNYWFERFTDVEMADFNDAQIGTFIRNWFQEKPRAASDCWERLKSTPQLHELASVPLLLTLLCVAFEENFDFPPSPAELYKEAIDALLKKWDASRQIRRSEVYKNLSLQRKEAMFARIAAGTFLENQYFIPESVLTQQIRNFIEHMPGFEESKLDLDSQAVLQAIEAQHGIFVERAKAVHSFAHLTFQEYFTAKYIVDNSNNEKTPLNLENLVNSHLYEDRWKEVFLLVAGMLDSADELLIKIKKRSDELLEIIELNELVLIAEKSLLIDKNQYPSEVRRAVAISIALSRTLARKKGISPTDDSELIDALKTAYVYSRHFVQGFEPKFSKKYTNNSLTLNRSISLSNQLDISFIHINGYGQRKILDEHVVLNIARYLKANHLIILCLQSDAYVSKPVREKILHEMLMPRRGEGI